MIAVEAVVVEVDPVISDWVLEHFVSEREPMSLGIDQVEIGDFHIETKSRANEDYVMLSRQFRKRDHHRIVALFY